LASAGNDTRQAIADFGQMCEIEFALPATVHLLARYEHDLENGLIENVMSGGDSAARGMAAGMVLGAYLGPEAIPLPWCQELLAYSRILDLLKAIDAGN
jgi:ADP-ribosylglycohydrolase